MLTEYLGGALRLLRQQRGWSQSVLAEKGGVRPNSISRFEAGNKSPSLQTLEAILRALGCDLHDLQVALDAAAAGAMEIPGDGEAISKVEQVLGKERADRVRAALNRVSRELLEEGLDEVYSDLKEQIAKEGG